MKTIPTVVIEVFKTKVDVPADLSYERRREFARHKAHIDSTRRKQVKVTYSERKEDYESNLIWTTNIGGLGSNVYSVIHKN